MNQPSIKISVKKGYTPKIIGIPTSEITSAATPRTIAMRPEKIPYIKPKLHVAEGDSVKRGTLVFSDKKRPELRFCAPGGGRITAINYGPRRVIREVVIRLAESEPAESFTPVSGQDLPGMTAQELLHLLAEGGMLPLIRQLPFNTIADPETSPPAILVPLTNSEPFHPPPGIYLDGKEKFFEHGLQALRTITPKVHVYAHEAHLGGAGGNERLVSEWMTHTVSGNYPADHPGVLLYHIRKEPADNPAWYMHGQDVLLLGEFLKTGQYPTDRIITVAGSAVEHRRHVRTRIGAPVRALLPADFPAAGNRIVAGGVFNGYDVSEDTYVGLYETALTVLPEGDQPEFFGFARPGFHKLSFSRSFLSAWNPSPLPGDCGMHGEHRACVNCSYCAGVCPVDILPQFTYKALVADDIEDALAHGLLDCVTCGLCSFVCPSKVELRETLQNAKLDYYKEQTDA